MPFRKFSVHRTRAVALVAVTTAFVVGAPRTAQADGAQITFEGCVHIGDWARDLRAGSVYAKDISSRLLAAHVVLARAHTEMETLRGNTPTAVSSDMVLHLDRGSKYTKQLSTALVGASGGMEKVGDYFYDAERSCRDAAPTRLSCADAASLRSSLDALVPLLRDAKMFSWEVRDLARSMQLPPSHQKLQDELRTLERPMNDSGTFMFGVHQNAAEMQTNLDALYAKSCRTVAAPEKPKPAVPAAATCREVHEPKAVAKYDGQTGPLRRGAENALFFARALLSHVIAAIGNDEQTLLALLAKAESESNADGAKFLSWAQQVTTSPSRGINAMVKITSAHPAKNLDEIDGASAFVSWNAKQRALVVMVCKRSDAIHTRNTDAGVTAYGVMACPVLFVKRVAGDVGPKISFSNPPELRLAKGTQRPPITVTTGQRTVQHITVTHVGDFDFFELDKTDFVAREIAKACPAPAAAQ